MVETRSLWVAVGLAGLLGCGPSMKEIKEARESLYQTDQATVWEAVRGEMHDQYHSVVEMEDPKEGLIKTRWRAIETSRESTNEEAPQPFTTQSGSKEGNKERIVFRIYAKIEPGGPPWYVWVDGEAAKYIPGSPMLQPYKHGADDEPPWVSGRIDSLRMGIHERLKAYAVRPAGAQVP